MAILNNIQVIFYGFPSILYLNIFLNLSSSNQFYLISSKVILCIYNNIITLYCVLLINFNESFMLKVLKISTSNKLVTYRYSPLSCGSPILHVLIQPNI